LIPFIFKLNFKTNSTMTIIFLQFATNPASVENVMLVTSTLQDINPNLMETARTQDSITLSSPDEKVDIYGNVFQEWLSTSPPIIGTYKMSGDPYPLLSGL
jgi:hypothetical protein